MNVNQKSLKHLLRKINQVSVVSVGHVELESSELRIVRTVDTFISEHFANLVHSVKPSNNELFEEELGGNSQL